MQVLACYLYFARAPVAVWEMLAFDVELHKTSGERFIPKMQDLFLETRLLFLIICIYSVIS